MKSNCSKSHTICEPYSKENMDIVLIAKVLSNPIRLFILKEIITGKAGNVSALLDKLPIKQSTISRHIKELKFAGLIIPVIKPPKVWYRVNEETWRNADKVFREFFGFFYSTPSNKSY